MQKHLSPWREMPEVVESDRRVQYAQIVTLLPPVLTVLGLAWISISLTKIGWWRLAGLDVAWWRFMASFVIAALYGFAAWRIGRRERIGGIIALTLFAGNIVTAALHGRIVTFWAGYSVLGIVLVLRAAEDLHLRVKWNLMEGAKNDRSFR
jgi:hypothetical protein